MTAALLALNARTFASLRRHRNYRLFFTGQVISVSGTWMQNVALAWLVVELTHSPLAVGAARVLPLHPLHRLRPLRGRRRRPDRQPQARDRDAGGVDDLRRAARGARARGRGDALCSSTCSPSSRAPRSSSTRPAATRSRSRWSGAPSCPTRSRSTRACSTPPGSSGPAIAGVLIAAFGVGVCFAINAVTFLAVLARLLLMRTSELVPVARSGEPPTMLRGIREGFSWVLASPQMRLVLAIVTVVSTVGFNFHVILPLLASETLAGRAGGLRNPLGELRRRCARRGTALRRARASELEGARRRHRRLQPLPARARPAHHSVGVRAAPVRHRCLLHALDVECELDPAAAARPTTCAAGSSASTSGPSPGSPRVGGLLAGWLTDVGGTQLASRSPASTGLTMTLLAARELTRRYPGRVRFGFTRP